MFKNRFLLVLGLLSLLLVAMAVSLPPVNAPISAESSGLSKPAIVTITGRDEFSDYYQRHRQPPISPENAADLSDYFLRH